MIDEGYMALTIEYTRAQLQQLSTTELLALFQTLAAPALSEMNGEYRATLLQQPSWFAQMLGRLTVANPLMPWLCKAFRPVSSELGRGYNTFSLLGKVVQLYPMQTCIAPSRYDGKLAYQLVYRAYHSLCGDIHMVDEVRQLAPNLYLGIGTWGFTAKQRHIPLPFLLEGAIANYRADIGQDRQGFQPQQEIPALASSFETGDLS